MAIELAAHFDAQLMLLYVQEVPPMAHLGPPIQQSVLDEMDAQVRRLLDSWKRESEELGARRSSATMVVGVAFDQIVRFASESRADLIVMGTHGRTALRHVLIGSVAEKVVRHARCPVLTIHPPELRPPGGPPEQAGPTLPPTR